MRHAWSVLTVALLMCGLDSSAQVSPAPMAKRPCREHPQLIGQCFTIRGRMNYWNGAPSVRIWQVGTKRILGVSEGRFKMDGYLNLPAAIEAKLSWESDLFGDFVVCPFTPDEPGVMRFVCVDSAKHLSVRAHKGH